VDSLDLLIGENRLLLLGFDVWTSKTVEDPAEHGQAAKFVLRHLAIRETARDDVVRGLSSLPTRADYSLIVDSDRRAMRETTSRLAAMSRGVPANDLDFGQPFNETMYRAWKLLELDMSDQLDSEYARARSEPDLRLHSGSYIRRHTANRLSPTGLRWYERIGILQSIHAGYDWLCRNPTFQRSYLPESLRRAESELFANQAG
jgi:hypothetical protein